LPRESAGEVFKFVFDDSLLLARPASAGNDGLMHEDLIA